MGISGSILVACEGGACTRVIEKANDILGRGNAFRADKRYREHGADVVINIIGSEKQVQKLEKEIEEIDGVKEITTEIS